jgi:hypothetical protein
MLINVHVFYPKLKVLRSTSIRKKFVKYVSALASPAPISRYPKCMMKNQHQRTCRNVVMKLTTRQGQK